MNQAIRLDASYAQLFQRVWDFQSTASKKSQKAQFKELSFILGDLAPCLQAELTTFDPNLTKLVQKTVGETKANSIQELQQHIALKKLAIQQKQTEVLKAKQFQQHKRTALYLAEQAQKQALLRFQLEELKKVRVNLQIKAQKLNDQLCKGESICQRQTTSNRQIEQKLIRAKSLYKLDKKQPSLQILRFR